MTVAAIDRLVHHAVVVEMNVESYRQRSAVARKGRTAAAAKKVDQPKEAPTVEPP
jgi:IstB-like ATP binding protein